MKPIPERLHIDELKRVEQQTGNLLKAWRKLNKDFNKLQEKFAQLTQRYEQSEQEHARVNAQREEEAKNALEALEKDWQARYARDQKAWEDERLDLLQNSQALLDEREKAHKEEYEALRKELDRANLRKQAIIDRIRGVEHE